MLLLMSWQSAGRPFKLFHKNKLSSAPLFKLNAIANRKYAITQKRKKKNPDSIKPESWNCFATLIRVIDYSRIMIPCWLLPNLITLVVKTQYSLATKLLLDGTIRIQTSSQLLFKLLSKLSVSQGLNKLKLFDWISSTD
jgi:hypothetical protein